MAPILIFANDHAIWRSSQARRGELLSNMRNSTSGLLARLAALMGEADMQEVADVLGVSLATSYRYRKNPGDISVAAFERLATHFNIPVSINLLYREGDVISVEEARLKLEEEIATCRGWRFVTTQHFTVNCEIESFTRQLFSAQYENGFCDAEINNYIDIRQRRRKIYMSGQYSSREVISGPSYIDFFYNRGIFANISKSVRDEQLNEVLSTSNLPFVNRNIYTQNTPELPTILNYSSRKSVIRVEDITIFLTDEDCEETNRVLETYSAKAEYKSPQAARAFFSNPLNPQKGD